LLPYESDLSTNYYMHSDEKLIDLILILTWSSHSAVLGVSSLRNPEMAQKISLNKLSE